MKRVTSLTNPDIKRVRSLGLRKNREEEQVFVAEGLRHTLEAAEAGWAFDTLIVEDSVQDKELVQKLIKIAEGQNANILDVPRHVMEGITKRDNAQTVMAVLKQSWATLAEVDGGLWVLLEEIRDPGNLGTILRTCDGCGAKGVILVGKTCDPYSLESVRASMGAIARIKVLRATLEEAVQLKDKGFRLIGTHLETEHDYRTFDYTAPLILVMGNEQAGMSDAMTKACTALVKIPMRGKADSLNVSVAAGVMLYEINRSLPAC